MPKPMELSVTKSISKFQANQVGTISAGVNIISKRPVTQGKASPTAFEICLLRFSEADCEMWGLIKLEEVVRGMV